MWLSDGCFCGGSAAVDGTGVGIGLTMTALSSKQRPIDSATQPLSVIASGGVFVDTGAVCDGWAARALTANSRTVVMPAGRDVWLMPAEEQDRRH